MRSGGWIILATAIFAPIALLLGAHAVHMWVVNRLALRSADPDRDRAFLLDIIGVSFCIIGCVTMIAASGNEQVQKGAFDLSRIIHPCIHLQST